MTDYPNHYLIEYSSDKWESRTVVESTINTYQEPEDWALSIEESGEEDNVQVWEFQPISGVVAAIINFIY